jgi:phosphomevalonate kinase
VSGGGAGAARVFAAPGKLMIAGEYSVLGPEGLALAAAVAPGLEVQATPAAAWSIERADRAGVWRAGDLAPDPELRFAHAALRAALERVTLPPHHLLIRGAHATGEAKPGLGGSASATAATAAAVLGLAGGLDRDALLEVALRSHQQVQGGRGSGYDVATVVSGGLITWQPAVGAQRLTRLCWPEGLELVAAFSGQSARTVSLLERVEAAVAPDLLDAQLAELARPVAALAAALEHAEVDAILTQVRACHTALCAWDAEHDLGLVTAEISELIAAADGPLAAAKVSGAGGGDSVVALCHGPVGREGVLSAWRRLGRAPLAVELDAGGTCETSIRC